MGPMKFSIYGVLFVMFTLVSRQCFRDMTLLELSSDAVIYSLPHVVPLVVNMIFYLCFLIIMWLPVQFCKPLLCSFDMVLQDSNLLF